jgi:hypothetical protein
LAQKDSDRGVLEPSKVSVLRETIESLFADLVRESWTSEREAHAMASAGAGKLPFLGKDQMVSSWRTEEPVLLVGVFSELDDAAASILATIAEVHGTKTKTERLETLRRGNAPDLALSGTALVCLSSVDIKTPAHIHYAARHLRKKIPGAKLLLAVWSDTDEEALRDLKAAMNADYVARTFNEAARIILEEASGTRLPRADAPPMSDTRSSNLVQLAG